ncbi:MAG: hypothetical protein SV377_03760 [Halobacteria archaeon]|nr:hypothetical protein [Halobacteria archaeon]
MNRTQKALVGIGVVLVALGFAIVIRPELSQEMLKGINYTIVTLIGVLALIQGFKVARRRRKTEIEEAETENPEIVPKVPAPGDDFDDDMKFMTDFKGHGIVEERRKIRDRIEEAAIEVLVRYDSYSRDSATEMIKNGTWTDDPHAAAFLAPEIVEVPLSERFRAYLSPETQFELRSRHAIDVITSRAGFLSIEGGDGDE